MQLSGFTILRNASKLDYPFPESLLSILPLCDEFIINCGDSEDDTLQKCEAIQRKYPGKIKILRSVWEREKQSGGFQLRYQTNAALSQCKGKWCFYLQADEAIHEADISHLKAAISAADCDETVDGILFDYLHFYGSYSHLMTGRNWYRREVRAFKNHRGIQAYRDAQGFRRKDKKLIVVSANARVFHYGYVRSGESIQTKTREMSQWWGEPPDGSIQLQRRVGLKKFHGSHPKIMSERIKQHPFSFQPENYPRKWDLSEVKNAITLAWESVFPYRIGEFKNYVMKSNT